MEVVNLVRAVLNSQAPNAHPALPKIIEVAHRCGINVLGHDTAVLGALIDLDVIDDPYSPRDWRGRHIRPAPPQLARR